MVRPRVRRRSCEPGKNGEHRQRYTPTTLARWTLQDGPQEDNLQNNQPVTSFSFS
jgi:hypothetical protein